MKKIWRLICRVFVIGLVSVFIGYDVYLFNATYICKQSLPMPFGVGHAIIMSGSMEPTISVLDVVVIKRKSTYEIGDIVTYQAGDVLVTHRIIEKSGNIYITRGDANNAKDPVIHQEQILGYVVKNIPNIGGVLLFLQKPIGMVCIMLVLLVCMEISFRKTKEEKNRRIQPIRSELEELRRELELIQNDEKQQEQIKQENTKQTNTRENSVKQEIVVRVRDVFVPDSVSYFDEREKQKENSLKEKNQNIETKKERSTDSRNSIFKELTMMEKMITVGLCVLLLINITGLIVGRKQEPVRFCGNIFVRIEDDSMQPVIRRNDVVRLKNVEFYEVGDVVTFVENGTYQTHRIVETTEKGFVTKADARAETDENYVISAIILGRVVEINGILATMFRFFTSALTFMMICILMLVWVLFELFGKKCCNRLEGFGRLHRVTGRSDCLGKMDR